MVIHSDHLRSLFLQNRSWAQKVNISHHQRPFHWGNRINMRLCTKISCNKSKYRDKSGSLVKNKKGKGSLDFALAVLKTSVNSSLKIFFLLLNSWTSCPYGKRSKWGRLAVYLPWLSECLVCVKTVLVADEIHIPSQTSEKRWALNRPSRSGERDGADGFCGGRGLKSLWAAKCCSPPPIPRLRWPKQTWRSHVNGCWVEYQKLLLFYSAY